MLYCFLHRQRKHVNSEEETKRTNNKGSKTDGRNYEDCYPNLKL